jgi:4-hydroxybenzoate polyprenyltransferase
MEVQDLQTQTVNERNKWISSLQVFAADIKLSHSIFALPFVVVGLTLVDLPFTQEPLRYLQILVCMVLARSFAMGMNRYLDRDIDRENARTKTRALAQGIVSSRSYLHITLLCGVGFVLVAASLSRLAGVLSPLLLLLLAFYSVMKKLSWMTHWYLGFCLGLAPVAAELALFDKISEPNLVVGLAVMFWTAGFDLLYSLQDREFDKGRGLHSVPAKLGHKSAIWLSRLSFVLMVVCLAWAGQIVGSGAWWFIGVAAVGGVLTYEHWIIRDAMITGTSNKINVAFFNLNALVSIVFCAFAILDFYGRS